MDEGKRDIYNRFGEEFLQFDPRQDDLKLLSSVAATYVYWGVVAAKVRNNHDANMLKKNYTLKLLFVCLVFSLAATSALCKTRTSPIAVLLLVGEGSLVS